MVKKVVPHNKLRPSVVRLAGTLKGKSGSILRLGLEAFENITDMEYDKAVSYLKDMAVILTQAPDSIEGTRAFAEKRKPEWKYYPRSAIESNFTWK